MVVSNVLFGSGVFFVKLYFILLNEKNLKCWEFMLLDYLVFNFIGLWLCCLFYEKFCSFDI